MKQVKFFLVALMAVVMGMSVTSCMNGDDNHNVTMTVPVKYNYSSFLMEMCIRDRASTPPSSIASICC